MMIYFKSGETLHIQGKEGERVKRKISEALQNGAREFVAISHEDRVDEIELIVDLREIAAMR